MSFEAITPGQLVDILSLLFQPNTETVKNATKQLKEYFKTPHALKNLLILVQESEDTRIRQVSCVYLRRIIDKLWLKIGPEDQAHVKQVLLQRFIEEPVPVIKKNIAEVIGALGKILIPNREWNELF